MYKKITRLFAEKIARITANHMSTDIDYYISSKARDESAEFCIANMKTAEKIYSRDKILEFASIKTASVAGCICEFGVYKGWTLKLLANLNKSKKIHGFDSFKGLPADWRPSFSKGRFATDVPKFKENNIVLHVGWFNESLPGFIGQLKDKICLLHVDCDLYESTYCVLDSLWDHLADDVVIVFDEYFNYPGWAEHEHKALNEIKAKKNVDIEYIAYNPTGEQVAIRLLKKASNS
jgi:hypothetical protein